MNETKSAIVTISEADLFKIVDELHEGLTPKIPYSENQIEMANDTIRKMKYHIERTLERLDIASNSATRT